MANPRGTTQDNAFAVERTIGSLKAITNLRSGRQPSQGVKYPSDSKPSAKFIPPSPPPALLFSPILSLHLIQIKHLLIFLRLLTLTDLPQLAKLSCLKVLGRSSKMCTSIPPSWMQSNRFQPIPNFSKISTPSRERRKYVTMPSLPHLS